MNQHRNIDSQEAKLRDLVAASTWRAENELFEVLTDTLALSETDWNDISGKSTALIEKLRTDHGRLLIDQFLTEYGLANDEGVQLMRLAEALSRTVDSDTANDLIRDKISGRDWLSHSGAGHSLVMSLAGRALHLTDKWLRWSNEARSLLTQGIARLGNSAIRIGTRVAVRALSSQFVFAESLDRALQRAAQYGKKGYLFSFDMLGEAARTTSDAEAYYAAYVAALDKVAANAGSDDPRQNHGISIKLSALHPRYEFAQADHVVPKIVELIIPLAIKARHANVQITIDAEESERLDISMDVLASLVAQPELQGWHGLGFVVQAYQRRALPLINWLEHQATALGAPLFIRLVKGAYWDSEIKRAQEFGLDSYPVYTRKEMTDLSYLACARKLLAHPDRFSPQFATHNAHGVTAVRELVTDDRPMEFQRLFGMGQQLHDTLLGDPDITSRIYAPVGTQKDLLSYLIRRLLENGANSSFVNKLADPAFEAATLSLAPVATLARLPEKHNINIPAPRDYLGTGRSSAAGWDLSNILKRQQFEYGLAECAGTSYRACPVIGGIDQVGTANDICNPAELSEIVGQVASAESKAAQTAVKVAHDAFPIWTGRSVRERADILNRAADLLEERASTFHYLAIKEAGKTWSDAVDEVREAIDFCRYYADRILTDSFSCRAGLGVVVCISPWNFPLAIFLGQVVAALTAGNSVVAKPAEQTPLIAAEAISLLLDAGVDAGAIAFVPGDGKTIGETLVADPLTAAVCFTGSTATAKIIASKLAETGRSMAPLIAETGGINAMIVDSSALLEQTVDAVISSAFQSAGQRCSALRILCVQEDIADNMIDLLSGAMDALTMGSPNNLDTDIGPVIDQTARQNIQAHVDRLDKIARRIGSKQTANLSHGHFIAPAAFELDEFGDLDREVFGPVLHVVRFKARDRELMIRQINASGYGLTMGIQSRIDNSCNAMASEANVGNIYINRNQIGAVVGVQPFGGNGLSGTGPKAGGPLYLNRLSQLKKPSQHSPADILPAVNSPAPCDLSSLRSNMTVAEEAHNRLKNAFFSDNILDAVARDPDRQLASMIREELALVQKFIATEYTLPSPAGETNSYSVGGRGVILLLLSEPTSALRACIRAVIAGNSVIQISRDGKTLDTVRLNAAIERIAGVFNLIQSVNMPEKEEFLEVLQLPKASAVVMDKDDIMLSEVGSILAERAGAITPILSSTASWDRYIHEKTITDNIAAAGGDVTLLNA